MVPLRLELQPSNSRSDLSATVDHARMFEMKARQVVPQSVGIGGRGPLLSGHREQLAPCGRQGASATNAADDLRELEFVDLVEKQQARVRRA